MASGGMAGGPRTTAPPHTPPDPLTTRTTRTTRFWRRRTRGGRRRRRRHRATPAHAACAGAMVGCCLGVRAALRPPTQAARACAGRRRSRGRGCARCASMARREEGVMGACAPCFQPRSQLRFLLTTNHLPACDCRTERAWIRGRAGSEERRKVGGRAASCLTPGPVPGGAATRPRPPKWRTAGVRARPPAGWAPAAAPPPARPGQSPQSSRPEAAPTAAGPRRPLGLQRRRDAGLRRAGRAWRNGGRGEWEEGGRLEKESDPGPGPHPSTPPHPSPLAWTPGW